MSAVFSQEYNELGICKDSWEDVRLLSLCLLVRCVESQTFWEQKQLTYVK